MHVEDLFTLQIFNNVLRVVFHVFPFIHGRNNNIFRNSEHLMCDNYFWEQDYHLIESFKIEPEANTNIGFPWIDVYKKLKKNNSERILLVKNNVLINYGQEAHKFFNLNYSISYSLSTNLQRTIIKAGPAADEMFFMYAKHLIKYHYWHDKRITFLYSILVLILVVTKMMTNQLLKPGGQHLLKL